MYSTKHSTELNLRIKNQVSRLTEHVKSLNVYIILIQKIHSSPCWKLKNMCVYLHHEPIMPDLFGIEQMITIIYNENLMLNIQLNASIVFLFAAHSYSAADWFENVHVVVAARTTAATTINISTMNRSLKAIAKWYTFIFIFIFHFSVSQRPRR